MFFECPRCFYLDRRLGVGRPDTYPLTLNIAVDHLLKKEFDIHRVQGKPHPFMTEYGIDAVPFDDPRMEEWRQNFVGIQYLHEPTNFIVFGAVDDIWQNSKGELIVVDYKATAKSTTPTLDGDLGAQYKRQMEVYQWLLKKNGFSVSPKGYFVYVNGKKDTAAFDKRLEFDVCMLPCEGNTDWIEDILLQAKETLMSDALPATGERCTYCPYREEAGSAIRNLLTKKPLIVKEEKKDVFKETLF